MGTWQLGIASVALTCAHRVHFLERLCGLSCIVPAILDSNAYSSISRNLCSMAAFNGVLSTIEERVCFSDLAIYRSTWPLTHHHLNLLNILRFMCSLCRPCASNVLGPGSLVQYGPPVPTASKLDSQS
ncbi:hypothetical protein BD311DRAFT_762879, partial [Dichomitus squalens]